MTRPVSRADEGAATDGVPTPRTPEDTLIVSVDSSIPTDAPKHAAVEMPKRPNPVGLFVRNYSLPILLVVSILIYSFWGGDVSRTFNTSASWQNILSSQSVTGVLTLGILLTLVSGNFDLSIGNICGLSSVMTAAAYSHWHMPLVIGILIGVAIGGAVGGMNGFLSTTLHVDPFIITLGTASIILGFIDWYTQGQAIINGIPSSLINFGRERMIGIPDIAWVLAIVALLIYYLLEHTPYGRSLHAIGSNRAAAKLVGIRVERTITSAFALTGAFAGVAGVLLLANTGSGNPTIGPTFTLAALASAFLGAVSFKVGRLNVAGTLVAIFFLGINITGLTYAGVANWINEVFTGLTLILAVALAAVLNKERKAKRATGTAPSAEQRRNPS
ncbi:MAG TPA: ABC transporter permease [Mycobacteriales bacterium]|nr:ABC transporter permease [Mycobacteriales bacterium]